MCLWSLIGLVLLVDGLKIHWALLNLQHEHYMFIRGVTIHHNTKMQQYVCIVDGFTNIKMTV